MKSFRECIDQCHVLDGYSMTELLLSREDGAFFENLHITIIILGTSSSMRVFKSEGYSLQSQNPRHRAAPAMSYKGTYILSHWIGNHKI